MDEFSWFVGLFEGEGCFGCQHNKSIRNGKKYEWVQMYLTIKMTDEDVIARAAKFLGVTYKPIKSTHKQLYLVRKAGSDSGVLRELMERMRPHLSIRRQQQIDDKLAKAKQIREELLA